MGKVSKWLLYGAVGLVVALVILTLLQQQAIIRQQQDIIRRQELARRLDRLNELVRSSYEPPRIEWRNPLENYHRQQMASKLNEMADFLDRLEREVNDLKGEYYPRIHTPKVQFQPDDFK